MKILTQILSLLLIMLVTGCKGPDANEQNEDPMTYPEVIYPKYRIWTSPSSGVEPEFNSPSMEWPSIRNSRYSVRISSSVDFSDDLIEKDEIPFPIFNPHRELKPGTWYWQYRTDMGGWNEPDSFFISPDTRLFVTPQADVLMANIPSEHPRVLVDKNEWGEFRESAKKYDESRIIIREADQYLNKILPKEDSGISKNEGNTEKQKKKLALNASKDLGNRVGEVLSKLTQAYVLTGDEKYFVQAKKWMLEVSTWDPKGVTRLNNFGDSHIMVSLALGVDVFWDLLSPEEREEIIRQAAARADQFYHIWVGMTESRSSSMHVWQHILHRMVQTSVALLHHTPEAEIWMEYLYELWIAQNPKMGERDGAWFNGASYYTMGVLSQFDVPAIFKAYTGVDFMQSDWYRNTPNWLIYAFPVNSVADGFCNDGDKYPYPILTYAAIGDLHARFTDNPYAAWYAKQILQKTNSELSDDHGFRWFRMQHGYNMPSPETPEKFDLPQAAVYNDVGVAYMNTSLENSETNLMLSLRSSPFGSLGHTHADQNTFNIAYGGKRLFYNTGYRPAMGDPHFLAWHKHTQGHNGILIDGKGQPFNAGAYGFIPRFLHGEQISYALGDASAAYSGSDMNENTDHGMKKFKRHYIMLRPSVIVIYDDLEADHDAEWSWLLHHDTGLDIDEDKNTISGENEFASARVTLLGSSSLDFQLSDQFTVKPENFTGKRDVNGNLHEFGNQWHFKGVSAEKTSSIRYLAIIQVKPKGDDALIGGSSSDKVVWEELVFDEESGIYQVGGWEIFAEMNTGNPARIEIKNQDNGVAMVSRGILSLNGKKYKGDNTGSSKLLEEIDGELVFKETMDEIPASMERVLMK